jgi:3D (Asp-Asp-Asp) domain-containing protein
MLNKLMLFMLIFALHPTTSFAEGTYSKDPLDIDKYDFPEPSSQDLGDKKTLWATYYYLPQMTDGSGTYALRDMQGNQLGANLSRKEWCSAALEGSVRILSKNGDAKTFNYKGETTDFTVNCKDFFKYDVSKTKFSLAHGPYGDGLQDRYILAPFRTIATDNSFIPSGTIIYVPKARGSKITLPNGKVIIHDGYFFAGDKGGAIKNNHIDVFIGIDSNAPYFSWITSNQSKTFEAYIVKDPKIIGELSDLHAQ